MKRSLINTSAVLLSLAILAGCSGMTKNERAIHKSNMSTFDNIENVIDAFPAKIKSYDVAEQELLAPYAKEDNWLGNVEKYGDLVDAERLSYKAGLKTAKNTNTMGSYLQREAKDISGIKKDVDTLIATPDRIIRINANLPSYIENAARMTREATAYLPTVKNGTKKYVEKYPSRAGEITKRQNDVLDIYKRLFETNEKIQALTLESNLSDMDDFYISFNKDFALYRTESKEYVASLAELDKDYTTILTDMKVEYYIQLAYQTWDSYSDGRSSDIKLLPKVAIGASTYEKMLPYQNSDSIAGIYRDGVRRDMGISDTAWSAINKTTTPMIRRRDNRGSIWIEDIHPVYQHQYVEVEGSKRGTPKWEEVDEEDFALHLNDFGMAIESKAVGYFDDEAIKEAIPVGMDRVGNEKYGEWRNDDNGNSFWHYYGQYAFFTHMLGSPIYQNDYNRYNGWRTDRARGRSGYGYYGPSRTAPRYGSTGSRTTSSAAYKSSPFAKTGGTKAVPQSLKTKAASARSKGPGSRGK